MGVVAGGGEGFTSPTYRDVKLKTVRLCRLQRVFLNAMAPSFHIQVCFLVECAKYTVTSKLYPIEDSLDVRSFICTEKKKSLL